MAIVEMPSSVAARKTRIAISDRLATRRRRNLARLDRRGMGPREGAWAEVGIDLCCNAKKGATAYLPFFAARLETRHGSSDCQRAGRTASVPTSGAVFDADRMGSRAPAGRGDGSRHDHRSRPGTAREGNGRADAWNR